MSNITVSQTKTTGTERGLLLLPPVLFVIGIAATIAGSKYALDTAEKILVLGLASLAMTTPWLLRRRGLYWDSILGGTMLVLCSLGVMSVARVAPELLVKQLAWIALGVLALVAVLTVPNLPDYLRRYRYTWLFLGLLLAVITLMFGQDLNQSGVRLWLKVGPFTAQPSELLKILLVVFLASYLEERRDLITSSSVRWGPLRMPPLPYLLPLLTMVGLAQLILLFLHDLGPVLLYSGIFLGMIYIGLGKRSYLFGGLLLFALACTVGYSLSDHVQNRFNIWLDPWSDYQGFGYQSVQALTGMAFGGVAGRGPGYGYPTLIPAGHTDYPLAVIAEEWGFLGTVAIILLYALLTTRCLVLAIRMGGDHFYQLLAAGLGMSIGLQAFIILGGVMRLIPLTGITSPFLSYGGSSMVMNFITVGIIFRLWRDRPGT